MEKRIIFRRAVKATLPVMAGYLVLGIGFGVLMHSRGLGIGWTALMSLCIYAGSMQYASVELLTTGAGLVSTALMTLMINARHFFYGLSMLDKYKNMGRGTPYLIFSLTDETYSLLCTDETQEGRKTYYYIVSVVNHCYWVVGSLLGALLGMALPFDTTGVDFSMTALFVVIFIDQWQSAKQHGSALIGLGLSVLSLLIFGRDKFLIPAMVAIVCALVLLRRKLEVSDD